MASDFYPPMDTSTQWVFRKLSDDVSQCSNGSSPFAGCVQSLDFNNMPDVATGENYPNGTRNFQFWTFSPFVNGYSLLGELDKVVNMSPKRFDSLQFPGYFFKSTLTTTGNENAGMIFGVTGVPQEQVNIWVIHPDTSENSAVMQLSVTIPDEGRTVLVIV